MSCAAWPLAAAAGWPAAAQAAGEVRGQGASFPSKVYAAWARCFAETSGIAVSYKATGSGDGVAQVTARKVDFGATDSPLSEKDLSERKLLQIPMLVGGVVPVVQLPGVAPGRLQLSGELLADLMLGRVERWDDPRVVALNRGLALPPQRVVRVVRADRSGTTEGYTRYLAAVSPAFRDGVGAGQQPKWPGAPGEVRAAEGNDGVSAAVKATPGAIGYVSFDRVAADGLAGVMLRNRAGQMVAASETGFRSAIVHSDLYREARDTASLVDMPGAQSWPITMTTFVLIDAEPPDAATVQPALRFLYWCFMRGDELTRGTGFAPLPTTAQARFALRFGQVTPRQGDKPLYQGF
jgi:phosphate transport system substrate-binding protein